MPAPASPYLPPEWAPHACVWVGWPHWRGEWGPAFDGARAEIAVFIAALSQVALVKVACGSREAYASAWHAFETETISGRIELHTLPAGDIWLRDTGPLFAWHQARPYALQFGFNGWGGKYQMPGDTHTSGAMASVEAVARHRYGFVLEGGAVEWDGAGRLLTTRQCLLHPNRQNGWDEAAAEAALYAALGVRHIHWLDTGLKGDHTDGHIDNIARFIGPGRVVCQHPSGEDDPNSDRLKQIEARLRGGGLDVVTIPSPGRVLDATGHVMPASHMNFLISNGHLFLPIFDSAYGQKAIDALAALLPHLTITPLPSRHILAGGGSFHCMTQQVPDFSESDICQDS